MLLAASSPAKAQFELGSIPMSNLTEFGNSTRQKVYATIL